MGESYGVCMHVGVYVWCGIERKIHVRKVCIYLCIHVTIRIAGIGML